MNLKIKETLAKIVNWLKGGEWITTTNTLCVQGETGADVGLTAKSIDGTGSVLLGVGSGGDNHGVYSRTMSRWMVHSDGTYTWFDDNNGGNLRWDMGTNNTSDTWVPVLNGGKLQRRVIPRNIMTTRQKNVQIKKTTGSSLAITADTVSGHTFVCWLQPATSGWIGSVYVEDPTVTSTKIWVSGVGSQSTQTGAVRITALYKANF